LHVFGPLIKISEFCYHLSSHFSRSKCSCHISERLNLEISHLVWCIAFLSSYFHCI